jgi:phospholipase C
MIPPLRPEELDIDSVVVVMMENRSFDHYFGALRLVEGRPVNGLDARFANPRPDGTPVPVFPMDLRCVHDPAHSWTAGRAQVNGGLNDGFVREHSRVAMRDGFPIEAADQVMGYHDRGDLPLFYALADEFVLCDQWHCSVLGPTWPNRFFLHSAQSGGRMGNAFPEDPEGFKWPTVYDRLDQAGIEWATYYGDLSFLLLFKNLREQPTRFRPFEQFLDDARSGRLPAVCHVEPTYFGNAANDDHPPHDLLRGQVFLSTVLRAIADGPQWARTLVLITYDEHGGFFDHVPPPMVDDERAADGFGQLGVRVPGLVVSPWARRAAVSSMLHEHSSVPAFLAWLHGLEPLTVRDAQANFFLDALDIDRIRRDDPRPMPNLPVLEVDPDVAPECIEFVEPAAAGTELAQMADAGLLPARFDRRAGSADRLRMINRELIRLGGARQVRRPRRWW